MPEPKYDDIDYDRLGKLVLIFGRESLMSSYSRNHIFRMVYPYGGIRYRQSLKQKLCGFNYGNQHYGHADTCMSGRRDHGSVISD